MPDDPKNAGKERFSTWQCSLRQITCTWTIKWKEEEFYKMSKIEFLQSRSSNTNWVCRYEEVRNFDLCSQDYFVYLETLVVTIWATDFLVAQMVKDLPAMWETWVGKIPLEKGMDTHPGILAWRIPWTEEPGMLQSMGSQRGGHDWASDTLPSASWNQLIVPCLVLTIAS